VARFLDYAVRSRSVSWHFAGEQEMSASVVKPSVALLVNQVSPYREKLYTRLAERFNLSILHGGMEANRHWSVPSVEGARLCTVGGWTFESNQREQGRVFDRKFLHIEPGYIAELSRLRPDAVITAEIGFRTFAALAYGAVFRVPVWVWWGGTVHTERRTGLLRRLVRWVAAKWVNHWISYGQTSTEYLITLGIPRVRILQVQNCVDESTYLRQVPAALELYPKPVLLHAGQLIARKGVEALLRAAGRLQSEGLEFSILLVGSGKDADYLRQLAADLNLQNVHFVAAQPAEAMPSYYRSADMLVFPTLADVWGLVANEAVLCGLPVLCSKYAGCAPELFDAECIFDPANDDEFLLTLRKGIASTLPASDAARLVPIVDVGDRIADAVLISMKDQSGWEEHG
jgi:glycosyltransferase involved in cell wall biosynthesis